jgi:16S rRNA (cytidine1402-2'-O)-methyltransferase
MPHRRDSLLYVVATPIGNLKDITLRALEILSDVDLIVSEHVKKTRNLLRHHGIKNNVLSYREENADRAGSHVMDELRRGGSVALVAEAGTPGVSDPGRRLVSAARHEGFKVVPVPGASAVVAALSVSGMDDPRFVFEGFLPRRSGKRRKRLMELAPDSRALVLFEAPHRLVECLNDMLATLGDRFCLIAREMTKMHEEIATGRISDFVAQFTESRPLGEFVIVCAGSSAVGPPRVTDRARSDAEALVAKGVKKAKAARMVAKKYGCKAGELYRMLRGEKNNEEGEIA